MVTYTVSDPGRTRILGGGETFEVGSGRRLDVVGPLGDFLESLKALSRLDIEKAFPGHGEAIEDLRSVAEGSLVHHRNRSDRIIDIIMEAQAHLGHLKEAGRIREHMSDDGVPGGTASARHGRCKPDPRSVDTSIDDVGAMLSSVWERVGGQVQFSGRYPGWKPNPDSPIVHLMSDVYRDPYGQEANVVAVHAGLECGTIYGTYPNLDMISIGPTLQGVHSTDERMFVPAVPFQGRLNPSVRPSVA